MKKIRIRRRCMVLSNSFDLFMWNIQPSSPSNKTSFRQLSIEMCSGADTNKYSVKHHE